MDNLQQTLNPASAQKTPEQERKELDKYRADLLGVHNQLKPHADLLNALKEQGITDVSGLQARLANQAQNPAQTPPEAKADPAESETTDPTDLAKNEREEMKGEIEKLRDIVQRQDMTIRTDKLQSQIQGLVKDKPEYSLLAKALDPSIAQNIMYQMQQDKQQGKNFEMSHYLNGAETKLRAFFEKMGGKLDEGKGQPTGDLGAHPNQSAIPSMPNQPATAQNLSQSQTQLPAEKKSTSDPSTITFPTLPGSGAEPGVKTAQDNYKAFMEKGRNPVSGKIDPEVAFEKDLSDFMSENNM